MSKFNSIDILAVSETEFSFLRIQDGIKPFFETPSNEFEKASETCEVRINANNLFSLFTANIIREEVTFTR